MRRSMRGLAFAGLVLGAACAQAQVDQFMKNMVQEPAKPGAAPTEAKVGAGLKEALQVAGADAISQTGRGDGYFGDPRLRLAMPERMQALERGLRAAGQGGDADEFVRSLNRAAEQSTPAARDILRDAIVGIGFEDARRVLAGGDTAATDQLRARAGQKLAAAFAPIVQRKLVEVGATRRYEALQARAASLPNVKAETVDLDAYVVGKTLDGLFLVMGQQEREIRHNPAARTSQLLRDVFGP